MGSALGSRASVLRSRAYVPLFVVAGFYAAAILAVALYPHPIDRPLEGSVLGALKLLHGWGLPAFVDYKSVEFLANVMFYVPVACAVALVLPRRRWWLVLVGAVALSTGMEVAQNLIPERVGSVRDVIANSLGALTGIGIAVAIRNARARLNGRTRAGVDETVS